MANFDPQKFKLGPCIVSYKNAQLGATHGGIKIDVDMDTVDIKCDQSYGQPVKRVITAIKLTVTMNMLEIDSNLSLLLENGKIDQSVIGNDLLSKGGILLLNPIDNADSVGYRFPNAVLEPKSTYALSSDSAHTIQLKFTAWPDAGGTFLEKVSA